MTHLGLILGATLGATAIAACGDSLDPGEPSGDPALPSVALGPFEAMQSCCSSGALTNAELRERLRRGGMRLTALQADMIGDNAGNGWFDLDPDDGGWDFILPGTATGHADRASPTNVFGATALGVWAARQAGASETRLLVSSLEAAVGLQRIGDVDSAPDFVHAVLIANGADNPGFAAIARDRYDSKRAARGGAAGLGAYIRDARHAADDDGLIPYDLGWFMLAAAALDTAFPGAGYRADADTYAQIVLDDLASASPLFEIENAHEEFYVTGLAWSILAAAWHDDHDRVAAIRSVLLGRQRPDGSWAINAEQPEPDLQSTAHAIQTLSLVDAMNPPTRKAVRDAGIWLLQRQNTSGGWTDASGIELPLVDADILLALMLSRTDIGATDGIIPGAPFLAVPASGSTAPTAARHAAPAP